MGWLWDYWPSALVFIFFVLFGIPEWAAIKYGGPTFSKFMATVANAGPAGKLWVFAWGLLIGGLAVHFVGWCVGIQGALSWPINAAEQQGWMATLK